MTGGFKKILALLLAIIMVFSLFTISFSVSAETDATETEYLTIGNPITVENSGKYAFVAPESMAYVFWTEDGHEPDTFGYILDSNGKQLIHSDNSSGDNYNFRAGYEMTAGKTYYIDIDSYCGGTFTLHAAESNVAKVEYFGNDIQFIEQDNYYGNWYWELNPNEKYFHYEITMHLYMKIKPTIKITYKDETSVEYTFGEENDIEYFPQIEQNQSFESPWVLGENEFYIYYDGVKCTVPVDIVETPVRNITLVSGDFTFEECNEFDGYWNQKSDPETGETTDFFYYYFYKKMDQVVLDVEYKDGTTETVAYLIETENGLEESGITYVDNQYETHWEPEKDNTIEISYKGFRKECPVTINPSPIASIEILNPEIFTFNECDENTGHWSEHYIDGQMHEYFCYNVNSVIDNLQIKVNYTAGESETLYYTENDIYYSTYQGYNNQWQPDGNNLITITYKGKKATANAIINPSPIKKIEIESIDYSFIENDESVGCWSNYDDGETFYNYFYYYPDYLRNHITLKITYTDNSSEIVDCSENYDVANELFIDTRQYNNPWTVGGENLVYITYQGKRATYNVSVIESNVSSIVINPCDFAYEECDEYVGDWHNYYGETNDSFHEFFYYEPLRVLEQMTFTVNYTDGTSETIPYNTENPAFSYNENQRENHWYPDTENILEIFYKGQKITHNVKINPSPVEKIELAYCNYTFLENDTTNGHWETYSDSEGNEIQYFHYYTNTFICHIGVLVTYTDDREPEVIRYDDKYGNETGLSCTTNQNDNPWVVGGNNIITIRYKGASCEYPVEIQRSPIESIEIYNNPFTFIENFNGCISTRYNEETDSYEEYFHYNCDSSKLQIMVTYNDGREPEIIGMYDENGDSTDLSTCDTQESKPWIKGANNTIEVSYYDKLIYAPVTITDSPVERIEVKYSNNEFMAEDTAYGEWRYYTNEETGEELRYFNYDIWSIVESAEYTIYYNDGRESETIKYYDEDYNNTGIIYSNEQHKDPWLPDKENYFTVGYLGATVQIPIVIKKNPVESISILNIDFVYPLNDERFGQISYRYDENDNEIEYFEYYLYLLPKYTTVEINYTDGSSEIVCGDDLDGFTYSSNQYYQPFSLGENEVQFSYMGRTAPGYVKVVQIPDFDTTDFEVELRGDNRIAIVRYLGSDSEVIIPETINGYTVVELCDSAFYDQYQLTSVQIPDTVETIGNHCFGYCYDLNTLKLPRNLKKLDRTALSFAGISELTLSEENEYYKVVDGVLFSKDSKTLCYYPYYDQREEYTVPEGTEIIGDFAISSDYLKNLYLPEGITTLGEGALSGTRFNTLTLPESLTSIGAYAFNSSHIKYLYIPKAVQKIGYCAFNYSQIEYITFSKNVKQIENDIFDGCENLKGIYFIGTEEEFLEIEIGPFNDVLFSTPIYYISEEEECSHALTQIVGAIQKDCWNTGYTGDEVCLTCSQILTVGEEIPEGHTESEPQDVIEATCSSQGYTGDIYCTECEELISWGYWYYEDHIPETTRRYAYNATCNDCGYTGDLYCSVCDTFIESGEYTEPTYQHNQNKILNAYEKTCYSDGYTGDKYCSVCETFMASGEIIPASHGETYLVGKLNPSCADEGYSGDTYCYDCDNLIEYGEVIAPYGNHVYNYINHNSDYHWRECGCGEVDTESKISHLFSVYEYDDNNHWKKCECGQTTATTEHSFDTLKTNNQQHYYECICGAGGNYEDHDFATLESDDRYHWYKCSCGMKELDIPHSYSIPNKNETHHWNECSCGKIGELIPHTLNEKKSDETYHWGECNCGFAFEKETHNFSNLSKNESHHWGECSCGLQSNSQEHTYTILDGDKNSHWYKCVCGAIGEVTQHDFNIQKSDDNNHWYECECGESTGTEQHNFHKDGSDSDYHWKECDCGKTTEIQEHYFNIENNDSENHWIECSCGTVNPKTVEPHDYNILNTDASQHWYTCTCGKSDIAQNHNYTINCNDEYYHWVECNCGASDSSSYAEHTFNAKNNSDYHWQECNCGKEIDKQEHNFNKENNDSQNHWIECSCGMINSKTVEAHDFNSLNTNASHHWYTCTCGRKGLESKHTYNIQHSNDEAHWNECACGESDSNSFTIHTFNPMFDDDYHWNECSCGKKLHKQQHNFNIENNDFENHWVQCSCGFKDSASFAKHTFNSKKDNTHHWDECSCGEIKNKQQHNFSKNITNNTHHWKECDCGAYDAKEAHSYNKYSSKGTYHVKVCACGKVDDLSKANHQYAGATCKADGKCACGATGGKLAHSYGSYLSNGTHHWKACSCGNTAYKAVHTKKTTVTKATLTTNGKVTTACTVCKKTLAISTLNKVTSFKLSTKEYTYNSKTRKPSVTVKDYKGNKLTENTDYTVKYASGCKNVGKYKVTITLKGNYSGTKTLYFTIVPTETSIKSVSAGSKKLTVKWTKKTTQVSGYEIQYSTSSSFKSSKTVKISSNKTTSLTIKSLKAKKKYYVRIRTYRIVNGTKFYSDWSSKKYATTKK